jgi:hypothetical protein
VDVALTLPERYARRKHLCAQTAVTGKLKRNSEGGIVTTFDKREEGFEKKFAHDEELKFKAFARRNKLLGLWAAGLLGKTGAEADAYAKEIVMADLAEHGDDDVIAKLKADLGTKATEQQIRGQMSELLATAVAQITKSG